MAAHIDSVDSLDGLDEESVGLVTALILHNLQLTPGSAAKLRATGHASVLRMLEPYKALDMIPEPASESPHPWDSPTA